jgi:beta-glucanase (GH16 family)
MLGDNIKEAGWPLCGEIDIMENVGYNPDSVFCSVHTESFNHVKGTQKTNGIRQTDSQTHFHLYAIEWHKDGIQFFVDDTKVLHFKNTGKDNKEWPFDKKFHLLLNVAVGGNWGGQKGIDENIFPATMAVDYVRVFKKVN